MVGTGRAVSGNLRARKGRHLHLKYLEAIYIDFHWPVCSGLVYMAEKYGRQGK
jgi:hypothetical protein